MKKKSAKRDVQTRGVWISEDTYRKSRAISDAARRSWSDWVRCLIEDEIARHDYSEGEPKRRASA